MTSCTAGAEGADTVESRHQGYARLINETTEAWLAAFERRKARRTGMAVLRLAWAQECLNIARGKLEAEHYEDVTLLCARAHAHLAESARDMGDGQA